LWADEPPHSVTFDWKTDRSHGRGNGRSSATLQ
jgi:hypothetical protein